MSELKSGMIVRIWSQQLRRTLDPVRLIVKLREDEDGERWACEVFGGEYDGRLCQHWVNPMSFALIDRKWVEVTPKGFTPF